MSKHYFLLMAAHYTILLNLLKDNRLRTNCCGILIIKATGKTHASAFYIKLVLYTILLTLLVYTIVI